MSLTPTDSKQARDELNLSQAKVSAETGINRAYLSQFENGSRILNDSTLNQLKDYYLNQGWPGTNSDSIEEKVSSQEDNIRVWDGFVIPQATEEVEAYNLLSEYHKNQSEIIKSQNEKSVHCWFFGFDEDGTRAKCQRLMLLMARNYAIVRQLHGQRTMIPTARPGNEIDSLGAYIEELFHQEKMGQQGQLQ